MAITTLAGLLEVLRDNRLLSAEQLDEIKRTALQRCSDARSLGKYLVQRGWLTVYQVNLVFQGQAEELVLGPYRILDRLGEGGVSQVFKAYDTRRNLVAAIKLFKAEMLTNAEAVGRFQREIRVVTQLCHPNIVRAYDANQVGDSLYLVMEYVTGTDLGKLVKLSGPLPVHQACDYTRQAALGLQHAHEMGLVHRDIKPANLLVTGQGTVVKILDLGLARLQPNQNPLEGLHTLTLENCMIGTPDYLSPEQARNPRTVDIRADIYSLGCTFYFLLSGQPPFPGASLMQKVIQHQQEEATPIESLRPEVPAEVGDIIRKMMAKRPSDRYQAPAEVIAALVPFSRSGPAVPAHVPART